MAGSRSGLGGVVVAGHIVGPEHDVTVDAKGVDRSLVDEAVDLPGRDSQAAGSFLYGRPLLVGIFHCSTCYQKGAAGWR